jgi:hypothetical protein
MKTRIAIMLSLVLGALALTNEVSAATPWHGSAGHSASGGGSAWHGSGGVRSGGGAWGHGGGGWRGGYRGGYGWGWGIGDVWFPWLLGAAYASAYAYPDYYAPYDYGYAAGGYAASAPAPVAVAPQKQYWYWCAQSNAYYPYVQTCAGAWQPVPTTPPGQ